MPYFGLDTNPSAADRGEHGPAPTRGDALRSRPGRFPPTPGDPPSLAVASLAAALWAGTGDARFMNPAARGRRVRDEQVVARAAPMSNPVESRDHGFGTPAYRRAKPPDPDSPARSSSPTRSRGGPSHRAIATCRAMDRAMSGRPGRTEIPGGDFGRSSGIQRPYRRIDLVPSLPLFGPAGPAPQGPLRRRRR
jgi:hypothetical protein